MYWTEDLFDYPSCGGYCLQADNSLLSATVCMSGLLFCGLMDFMCGSGFKINFQWILQYATDLFRSLFTGETVRAIRQSKNRSNFNATDVNNLVYLKDIEQHRDSSSVSGSVFSATGAWTPVVYYFELFEFTTCPHFYYVEYVIRIC
jgi:hypothetical protein